MRIISTVVLGALPIMLMADSADLQVRLSGARQVAQGERATYHAVVENRGPDVARKVVFALGAINGVGCSTSVTLETLAPGASHSVQCDVVVPTEPPPSWFVLVHAGARSDTPDPNVDNDSARLDVDIITPFPDLIVSPLITSEAAPPGRPVTLRVFYMNLARVPSRGATITIDSPRGFRQVPSFCSVTSPTRATCRPGPIEVEPIGFLSADSFDLEVFAPDVSDTSFAIEAAIAADEGGDANPANNTLVAEGKTYRTFFVTTAADRGAGSFRAAIEAANSSCFDAWPCLIAFRIPPAGQSWHTIRPESPLPVVNGFRVEIDATLQEEYFASTNSFGPEVELSGELVGEGDGLFIVTPCTSAVRGLAINGFPRVGLLLAAGDCPLWPEEPHRIRREITRNHIGTDPTGEIAKANGRGIHVGGSGRWSIRENVISGNRASGVFLESGVNAVAQNIIGLNQSRTGPLSNGASGVWVDRRASGSTVDHNMIGFNQHAGVAIDRDATAVSVYGNSLQANYHRGIDWGLDGAASGPLPIPEITSVRVEGGKTIVEGSTRPTGGTFQPVVQIYANDAPDPSGYGEGQYWLGFTRAERGDTFRFEYDGDLTGKWIAVTSTREDYTGFVDTGWGFFTTTSEFSRAVQVP